jgi:hypothetical protein
MTVEARGDLDCDGIWSSYKYEVGIDDNWAPRVSDLQTQNELE